MPAGMAIVIALLPTCLEEGIRRGSLVEGYPGTLCIFGGLRKPGWRHCGPQVQAHLDDHS